VSRLIELLVGCFWALLSALGALLVLWIIAFVWLYALFAMVEWLSPGSFP